MDDKLREKRKRRVARPEKRWNVRRLEEEYKLLTTCSRVQVEKMIVVKSKISFTEKADIFHISHIFV
jgi:hypothetical protein